MRKSIKLLITCTLFASTAVAQTTDSIQHANRGTEYGRGISFERKEATVAAPATTAEAMGHKTSINPSNMLYGLIPGLQVMQNAGNAWNDGATLYVRGVGTLSSKSPLVLVDGFERNINELSAHEIESVTVLKDAASTALYGIRGANGVIVVTTKRGKEAAPEISLSYEFNMGTPKRLPKFVDGYTYAQALNEGLTNDGSPTRYSAAELNAFRDQTNPGFYPNVDWLDESLRNHSFGDNITFSAVGGGKNVKYYTQLNFLDDRGILKPVNDNDGYSTQLKYSKLNVRSNLDIRVGNNTNVKLNLFGNFSEHNRPGKVDGNGLFAILYNVPAAAYPIKTDRNVWGGTSVYGNNPIASIAGTGYARAQGRAMMADIEINQKLDAILPGLTAAVRVGVDNYASYWESNTKNFAYESAVLDLSTGEETYTSLQNEGTLAFSNSTGRYTNIFNLEAWLNYKTTKGKHKLNATLLYAMNKSNNTGRNTSRAFIDVVGQAHYVYAGKYILDASLSGSASSILKPGHRWGIFPSIGAGWVLSEESALKADWLDLLKLRTSYGIVGRADYGVNLYKDIYDGSGSYRFKNNLTSIGGVGATQLGAAGLTYEKSHKLNVGADFMAMGKFSLTLDAFYDHRTDILVSGSGAYSSVLGINAPSVNDGVVNSYGFEAGANWSDRIGEVNYQIGANFSFVRSEVKEMNEVYRPHDYLKRTGQPVNQIFGYEVVGIYQSQSEIDSRPVKQMLSEVRPGDLMYKDQNGDNRIDEFDMVALGYNTTCPEIYYSLNLGAEYKGLGIYALFQGVGNYNRMLDTPGVYRPLVNNGTVSEEYYNNRWTPSTPDAKYPRLTSAGSANNYTTNSLWVADGSFLKLRTLELYYQIPDKMMQRVRGIKKAKVFARAHDLFTLDKIKIADPEAMGTNHPLMTQYTFGVNLSF